MLLELLTVNYFYIYKYISIYIQMIAIQKREDLIIFWLYTNSLIRISISVTIIDNDNRKMFLADSIYIFNSRFLFPTNCTLRTFDSLTTPAVPVPVVLVVAQISTSSTSSPSSPCLSVRSVRSVRYILPIGSSLFVINNKNCYCYCYNNRQVKPLFLKY